MKSRYDYDADDKYEERDYDDRDYRWDNEERRLREDVKYMKSQYLPLSIEILGYVEDECDMMEYAGSLMFDESPDRAEMDRVVKRIYEKATDLENFYEPVREEHEAMKNGGHCTSCRGNENWLENMIRVVLLNEMNYRRQRYRHKRDKKCGK